MWKRMLSSINFTKPKKVLEGLPLSRYKVEVIVMLQICTSAHDVSILNSSTKNLIFVDTTIEFKGAFESPQI